jgi:hypothetical protein
LAGSHNKKCSMTEDDEGKSSDEHGNEDEDNEDND